MTVAELSEYIMISKKERLKKGYMFQQDYLL